jgi:hypothetical protein
VRAGTMRPMRRAARERAATERAARAPEASARAGIAFDVLAFGLGLACAWGFDWRAADLVWALWLSSLVLGWLSLVVGIATLEVKADTSAALVGAGKLALVAFFTVHFGMFHFVHSVFLHHLLPVVPDAGFLRGASFTPGVAGYRLVVESYWPWLIVAAIAERETFWPARRQPGNVVAEPHVPGPAMEPAAAQVMGRPYRNVVRLHLLIFFFVAAAFLGLDNFVVYAVVSAVYFLPWRRLFGHGR